MDALPGWPSERKRLAAALVLVLTLGALQGARAALGPAPLERPPRTEPTPASPPATREADWRRGSFYRPAGSTAARPPLVLRPLAWRPAPRLARACSGDAGPSC